MLTRFVVINHYCAWALWSMNHKYIQEGVLGFLNQALTDMCFALGVWLTSLSNAKKNLLGRCCNIIT